MKRRTATIFAIALLLICPQNVHAGLYTFDSTVPAAGGCPQPNHFNLALSDPLNRRWSTSLPSLLQPTVLTVAASGTPAQLTEIEGAISDSFGAWSGVTGTTFNATAYPGLVAPLARVAAQNSCSNDAEDNVDGLNTICFNQSSDGFTTGVLAFTRIITANAAGVTVGSSAPAHIRRPDSRFGHAVPQRWPGDLRHTRRARHALRARAPTIWNRCSLTNSATGSASIIPAFCAPSCFPLRRRPASSSATVPRADSRRPACRR